MQIVDRGQGEPLLIVPGLQGRWEYARASVDAFAVRFRVVTASLADEPSAGWPFDPSRGIDGYVDHLEAVLDARGIRRAMVCGISFGGLVALRMAARLPERVRALVMISAPGPGWHLKPRHLMYARLPWLFGPIFLAESPLRLRREVKVAFPNLRARLGFIRDHCGLIAEAPLSVTRMAARARLIGTYDRDADARAITIPTLIVHGDPGLDHVVDAGGTREYASLIAGAQVAMLAQTGHLGSMTRPQDLLAIVQDFADRIRQGTHDSAA